MSAAQLGQFAEGVASWRRTLAAIPDAEARWPVFNNAAVEIVSYVAKGLDRIVAVDELQDMATAHGLVGIDPDGVQQVMADAFRSIEPADQVPDLDEQRTNDRATASLDEWDAGDDPGPIPPRQWLLGNQFCRGFISSVPAGLVQHH